MEVLMATASSETSAGAPATGSSGFRSKLRVVAHDHRTHDAPIEVPEGFNDIPGMCAQQLLL